MLFNSIQFLIFFPLVCIGYFIIPRKVKNLYLLAASYYFYMCWNPKYALLMLTSTVITFFSGFFIQRVRQAGKGVAPKVVVALSFISNLAILFFFKYFNFFSANVDRLLLLLGAQVTVPKLDVVLPVGISFYTFQALSYTMDVYNGDVDAEKNFINYALFVSFFPQLVAGPIERSKNLLTQVKEDHPFNFENMRTGLLMMGFGYFQKVVIAETAAIVVTQVYDNYTEYSGLIIVLATVLFAIQIYCDFGGYSNIARGAAMVMGFSLMENFHDPYFADSVADFWRRWHISLSTWFRDYLYIPLGGNRKGKLRKYFNLMVVFLTSGLWHGANWTYVVWGGVNGLFQVIGEVLRPVRDWLARVTKTDRTTVSYRFFKIVVTFVLIDFTWLFFRADNMHVALAMLQKLAHPGLSQIFDGTLFSLGLSKRELLPFGVALLLLLAVDILRECRIDVIQGILRQGIVCRWLLYFGLIWFILIFGVYGPLYDASQFIYFQF